MNTNFAQGRAHWDTESQQPITATTANPRSVIKMPVKMPKTLLIYANDMNNIHIVHAF